MKVLVKVKAISGNIKAQLK